MEVTIQSQSRHVTLTEKAGWTKVTRPGWRECDEEDFKEQDANPSFTATFQRGKLGTMRFSDPMTCIAPISNTDSSRIVRAHTAGRPYVIPRPAVCGR